MQTLEDLIKDLSANTEDPVLNFNVAEKYMEFDQTAPAVSFYLKCAEYGYESNPIYVYTSLLKIAECFGIQGGREHTLENSLLQAIQYMPKRPEAYFLLSRFYEQNSEWQKCYTFAEMGLIHTDHNTSLPAKTDYVGKFTLLFEKAVSGWWVGRKEESKQIFNQLLDSDITEEYRKAIEYNMAIIDN